jgi:hypothetical protein
MPSCPQATAGPTIGKPTNDTEREVAAGMMARLFTALQKPAMDLNRRAQRSQRIRFSFVKGEHLCDDTLIERQ